MDDLINEFITESTESLEKLDLELVKLEQNPQDAAILGTIFRMMHTIKGTCGFLGLPRLESVAHAGENVLGKIRDKKLEATPPAISLILEALDTIKALIDYLGDNGTEQEGEDSALIARLNRFAEKGVVTSPLQEEQNAASPSPPNSNSFPRANTLKDSPLPNPQGGREEAGTQSIRVTIDVLESLMQTVSELVLTRNQLMQISRTKEDNDFMAPLQQLSHITSELQDGVMKTRMQPIGNAWSKFPRLIRDLSIELHKKIDLTMSGAETELDRQLLEVIKDPLTHMVRNSCDHGLETPAERLLAGKPETGTVSLSAYHEGGHIIIQIRDDGRGIHIEKVKARAIARGLATEVSLAAMTEKQIAQFIFHAGFSTAEKITSVSGRGVGMDVVKTNIEKIGGTLELDSVWGKGSQVSIKIPLTLAIVSVLLVEAVGQKFAIPQINVLELVRVAADSGLAVETINNAPVLRLRDKLLPLAVLSEILGSPCEMGEMAEKELYVTVCRVGGCDFGIIVDRIYDTEEIVVKPVASILRAISVYSGNTILGDGSVIMILDPGGLAKAVGNREIGTQTDHSAAKAMDEAGEALVAFLLFTTGKGAPKSAPLEMVSRIEEINVGSIEIAGDQPVVQYRGELMRLITLGNDFALPASGLVDVIVFSYDKKIIGLVVNHIIDIVYTPFAIKLTAKEIQSPGYLGSMIVAGKSTDVVDVPFLLSDGIERAVEYDPAQVRH